MANPSPRQGGSRARGASSRTFGAFPCAARAAVISRPVTTVTLTIVLAAGVGRRMGQPKALLPWGGVALAFAHAVAAKVQGCGVVRVVLREAVARQLPAPPEGVRWCISHEDEALGPAASLAVAVREGLDDGFVAVSPVDLDPAAWRCLPVLVAAVTEGVDAAKPLYEGRRGHPVVLRAAVLAGYARGDVTPLRDVLRALGSRVVAVSVDVPEVLGDFDTPDALRDATGVGRLRA